MFTELLSWVGGVVAATLATFAFLVAARKLKNRSRDRLADKIAHIGKNWRSRLKKNRDGGPWRVYYCGLDDYIHLLGSLRECLQSHCSAAHSDGERDTMCLQVWTRQLPSDWPLWGTAAADARGKTPLERYTLDFEKFLTSGHTIEIRRVIVIDRSRSFRSRLDSLRRDVNHEHYSDYIRRLHCAEDDALYYETPRPWPEWLADVVFFGIRLGGGERQWLWAVTTSFDLGEDLILLRMLNARMITTPPPTFLPLPDPAATLAELANQAYLPTFSFPLANLKDSSRRRADS